MKKEKKQIMDIVFLLDRSGSMSGFESDTIGGYNGYLKKMCQKNARVTTVLFDDRYEMITKRLPIKDVKKMIKEARNLYVSCFFLVWKMIISD